MTILSPLALVFLAAVPVIILFYILRAQYERIPVPSTLLWRNVIRDTEGRPTWRPPVRNILLLLQILAALIGAFAMARPATLGQTAKSRVFILDASSSMQATDVQPTRFEEAKRWIADQVRSSQDGDTFAVIRMGSAIDVVETGDNRAQIVQSLGSLQPGVSGGDVRAALQVAGSLARERTGYRNEVTIVSDGAFGEVPPIESGLAELKVQTIGFSSDNQAIVSVRVRRILDGSNRYEGFARVMNYHAVPVEVPVRAQADGIQVENKRLRIAARGSAELIVPLSQSVKLFEVNLERADALPLDNYAQVVVPNEEVDLTLVSASPVFLERALKAVPNVKLTSIRPNQYRREAVGAITVFDNFLPRNRDQMPAGAMMIVNPPASAGSVLEVADLRQPQQIVRVNPRSPLLDSVDLSGVFLPKATRVKGPAGTSPVVESREATLVWEGLDDGRKTVIFGFDPRQPEIGQRLAFPLMLANSVAWLAPNAGSPTLAPGQTINLQPLRASRDIVVRDPAGKSFVFQIAATGRGKAIPYTQTELVGRYAVAQRGEKGTLSQSWFTVNAGEESHSDIRPKAHPPQSATASVGELGNAINRELWPWLAALGLGVLSLEWLVYVRR